MPPSIPGHILIRLDEKSVPLKMLQVRRWTGNEGFGLAGAQKNGDHTARLQRFLHISNQRARRLVRKLTVGSIL